MTDTIEQNTKITVSIGKSMVYINNLISLGGFNQSIYLEGPSGIGKSDVVRQLAITLGAELIDLRLGNLDIIDLNGIGIPDLETLSAIFTRPEFFPPEKSDKKFILFLDEFNHASEAVFGAAYQIVLERRMGTHTLPPNMLIIAAGNSIDDKGISFSLPSPLVNRFMKFNVVPNTDEWIEYGIKENIDYTILGFLKTNPKFLHRFVPQSNEDNFATPRNWVKFNTFLNGNIDITADRVFLKTVLNSLFGFSTMIAYENYLSLIKNLPELESILKGTSAANLNNELSSSYAFYMLVKNYLINNTDKIEVGNIFNLFKFINKQPNQEVMQMLFLDTLSILNKQFSKSKFNDFHYSLINNKELISMNKEFKDNMSQFAKSMK